MAWTGTWVFDQGPVTDGTATTTDTYTETIALVVSGTVEADDPRITGSMLQVMNIRAAVGPGPGEVSFARGVVRLDNEGGMWVGTVSAYGDGTSGPEPGLSIVEAWYVLEGGGDYEGLSTVFRWHSDDSSFEGVILPAKVPAKPGAVRRSTALLLAPLPATPITATARTPSPLAGVVTQEVEPGVLRIIRDGAGHDLDARHDGLRYQMHGVEIADDGMVWVASSLHGSDELVARDSFIWALGRPGTFGAAEGVPATRLQMVSLEDGTLLVIGDRVVRFDGTAFVPDEGPNVRQLTSGTLWLLSPEELMGSVADTAVDPFEAILAVIYRPRFWVTLAESKRSVVAFGRQCTAARNGVECLEPSGYLAHYLEGTVISQIATAPDGSVWAVGQRGGEGGDLYRILPN